MKKIIVLTAAILLIFVSCSKEAKLNRKLDGEWNVVSVDGESMEHDASMVFKFEKDKKEGDVTFTINYPGETPDVYTGTYSLTKDDVITMTLIDGANTDVMIGIVNSYTKTDMTMTMNQDVYVLKKK